MTTTAENGFSVESQHQCNHLSKQRTLGGRSKGEIQAGREAALAVVQAGTLPHAAVSSTRLCSTREPRFSVRPGGGGLLTRTPGHKGKREGAGGKALSLLE